MRIIGVLMALFRRKSERDRAELRRSALREVLRLNQDDEAHRA